MHIISFSWDDGFLKSSIKTAEIFERYQLAACFNVIATGHEVNFSIDDSQKGIAKGDFALWNELKKRGHEIMPHGYKHANKRNLSFKEGKELILQCLDIFKMNLDGFESCESIFNFPYNASTPELENWLPEVVKGFRTKGDSWVNALPNMLTKKIVTTGFGPGSCEKHLEDTIKKFLELPEGWLVYNLHGLDDEGWGPLSSSFLIELLDKLTQKKNLKILPTGKALGCGN